MRDNESIATSYFISPKWLLIIRIVLFLYVMFNFIAGAMLSGAAQYFRFFTNLNWAAISIYLLLVVFASLTHVLGDRMPIKLSYTSAPLLYDFMFVNVTCLSWIVSIVYWALLTQYLFSDIPTYYRVVSAGPHTLNWLGMMFELVFTKMTMEKWMVTLPLVSMFLYLFYVVVWKFAGWSYPYAFLDFMFSQWYLSLLGILGFAVFTVLVFFVNYLIIHLRDKSQRKKMLRVYDEFVEKA
ncbi:hypothetical protein EDD86DRAFT_249365 [Gorgonomyces haynaldii]|nr:hypothetical protein EDD86DRAFT_249365 [Gorgonomyces haynaldii]